jgi:hypothetical protein
MKIEYLTITILIWFLSLGTAAETNLVASRVFERPFKDVKDAVFLYVSGLQADEPASVWQERFSGGPHHSVASVYSMSYTGYFGLSKQPRAVNADITATLISTNATRLEVRTVVSSTNAVIAAGATNKATEISDQIERLLNKKRTSNEDATENRRPARQSDGSDN